MALKDMWRQTPHELEGRHIEKIVAWAGDGYLRDQSPASNEFREYLELIPSNLLSEYCQQCLDEPFEQSGLALQDLINELGKRLGFEVEFGRYRGKQAAIGFDGIWKFSSGHQAVIEVKKTSAYQVRLDTIATYRARLIDTGKLSADQSSVLIIVGRDVTGDLEAQIRGSRHAWDVRLISTEALLRLLTVKEELEDPTIVRRIHEILIPREFTKLDEIVELLFSAASDLRPTVEPESPQLDAAESRDTDDVAVATFAAKSIQILEQRLGTTLIKQTRSSWASADSTTVVICKASRTYGDHGYWFGFREFQMEMITAAPRGYCALQCGGADRLLLIPANDLLSWSSLMNRTESTSRPYWHIHISDFQLIRKPGSPAVDLRPYLVS